MPLRVGSDIGGTFTDLACIGENGQIITGKILSTPDDYAAAVVSGITRLINSERAQLDAIAEVLHGSTVASNAILEHRGARTALLTTSGFGDILEMRRIRVPRLYDPLYVKPRPLVLRRHRFEILERMGPAGEIIRPIELADVDAAIDVMREAGIEAVAITFLHSYANSEHERLAFERVRAALPTVYVSMSSEVLPEIKEYERTSTTVINAYLGPPIERYLRSLLDRLAGAGISAPLRMMQSSGGILDARTVLKKPCQVIECGPAAGVIGCARLGAIAGYPNIISLDMGGTTAKASLIESGHIAMADEYEVGGGVSLSSRLIQGNGYALRAPVIDLAEVGAGGGSIVWLDRAGAMKVGPRSAGASPGPACYGLGGTEPTVTDANLVLGYLNTERLAHGTMQIYPDLARRALAERIAEPIGGKLVDVAYGIHALANATMMRAIKAVSSYRGRNPKEFVMFAFGGSGPMHAAGLARELQIGRVIVPPFAGVFSAVGLLLADIAYTHARAFPADTSKVQAVDIEAAFVRLEADVVAHMGYPASAVQMQRKADLRYSDQAFELTVAVPTGALRDEDVGEMVRLFEEEHERTYGYRFSTGHRIEIVTIRVVGTVARGGSPNIFGPTGDQASSRTLQPTRRRPAYFGPAFGELPTFVVTRDQLTPHARRGPMIVEENETTVVVPPDSTAALDAFGNIVIIFDGAGA